MNSATANTAINATSQPQVRPTHKTSKGGVGVIDWLTPVAIETAPEPANPLSGGLSAEKTHAGPDRAMRSTEGRRPEWKTWLEIVKGLRSWCQPRKPVNRAVGSATRGTLTHQRQLTRGVTVAQSDVEQHRDGHQGQQNECEHDDQAATLRLKNGGGHTLVGPPRRGTAQESPTAVQKTNHSCDGARTRVEKQAHQPPHLQHAPTEQITNWE